MFEFIDNEEVDNAVKSYAEQRQERYNRMRQMYSLQRTPGAVFVGEDAEHIVASDLTLKGFHIFYHLKPSAPCDLIILKGRQTLRVEVKCSLRSKAGNPVGYGSYDLTASDVRAFVFPEGSVFYEPDPDKLILQFDADIPRCMRCGIEVQTGRTCRKVWGRGNLLGYVCYSCI